MTRGIGAEARQIDDGVFRYEIRELVLPGADQQRANEEVVPGQFVDDTHIDAIFGLRTAEQIGDIEPVLLGHGLEEILLERSEAHTSELQSLMRKSYAVFVLPTTTQVQPPK